MLSNPFEPPPQIPVVTDDEGYIRIKPEDWQRLIQWLERFTKHMADLT